jgi:aminoglycoside phosphotransferase (APT) family kinase protein
LTDTRPVRPGEELDPAALEAWIRERLPDLPAAPLEIEQFPGGHSNLTYLLRFADGGINREMVLRRPPFGSKVRTAHDMGRELRVLSHLQGHYPKAPRTLARRSTCWRGCAASSSAINSHRPASISPLRGCAQ